MKRFDSKLFFEELDVTRKARGLTWKTVAKEAGVSASSLTRMGQGKRPDVDTMAALAEWGQLSVDMFVLPARSARTINRVETEVKMTNYTAIFIDITQEGMASYGIEANTASDAAQQAFEMMRDADDTLEVAEINVVESSLLQTFKVSMCV